MRYDRFEAILLSAIEFIQSTFHLSFQISALNMVINILVIFACFFEDVTPKLSCGVITLVAGTVIISKIIYQFLRVPESLMGILCIAVSFVCFP